MRGTFYIRKNRVEDYLERKGFSLCTIRRVIIKEFGFKNGKEFLLKYHNLSPSVLNVKVAYKNKLEYNEIIIRISDILKYLSMEEYNHSIFGRDILFFHPNQSGSFPYYDRQKLNKSLYWYTVMTRFRLEFIEDIREKTGIDELGITI